MAFTRFIENEHGKELKLEIKYNYDHYAWGPVMEINLAIDIISDFDQLRHLDLVFLTKERRYECKQSIPENFEYSYGMIIEDLNDTLGDLWGLDNN